MERRPSIPRDLAQDCFVAGAGGVRVRLYRLHGGRDRRPVLIMGHCNGFAAGAYLPLLTSLAAVADVFAFDQRGHGGADAPSARDPEAYTPDSLSHDVLAVVAAVAARRPDGEIRYFGHSLSAAAMLRAATALPERYRLLPLRAVALVEPPIFPGPEHPEFDSCTRRTADLVARTRRRRTRFPDQASYIAGLRRYAAFAAFAPGMLEAVAAATLRPGTDGVELICDPTAEAAIFAAWGRPVLYPGLGRVPASPRLHLVGGDPTAPDPDWVTAMMPSVARLLPAARFEIMPGRGHLWPFEAPDETRAWITNALLAA